MIKLTAFSISEATNMSVTLKRETLGILQAGTVLAVLRLATPLTEASYCTVVLQPGMVQPGPCQ
jgi:hypothetical protein